MRSRCRDPSAYCNSNFLEDSPELSVFRRSRRRPPAPWSSRFLCLVSLLLPVVRTRAPPPNPRPSSDRSKLKKNVIEIEEGIRRPNSCLGRDWYLSGTKVRHGAFPSAAHGPVPQVLPVRRLVCRDRGFHAEIPFVPVEDLLGIREVDLTVANRRQSRCRAPICKKYSRTRSYTEIEQRVRASSC